MNPSGDDKTRTLSEAAELVKNGNTVTFSGISISAHPVAFAHELIRQEKRHLSIVGSGAWHVNNIMVGAGCVDSMIIIADSAEIGGVAPALRRAVEKGRLVVEDYSYFAIACRFMAAAMGVSFMPTKSMLGSDMLNYEWLEKGKKFRIIECPFTAEKVVLVPALRPDVAIVHAQQADREGNVQLLGPQALVDEQARASNKVIATVERIVSNATVRSRPELTVIPSFIVDAVVRVPYGAHPTSVDAHYDYDLEHLKFAFDQSKDDEKFRKYLDKFVYGVSDHSEYLKRIGGPKKLQQLRASAQ